MKKNKLFISSVVLALASQVQSAPKLDAGDLQQQIRPSTLPAMPAINSDEAPAFKINEIKDSTTFLVKTIRIVGNEEIDALVLHALVKNLEGARHSLADLQAACQLITDYYHAHGYGLARAILPPQEIEDGRVTIQIVEAKYGMLEIDNQTRIKPNLINDTLSAFKQGNSIKQYDLERALLLLSDIPGGQPNAVMKSGQKTTESDMSVEIKPTPIVNGKFSLDDFGNVYINRLRALGNLNVVNPLGYGDVLSISYLSTGERMQYFRLSEDFLINGSGTRVGVGYSDLQYKLGGDIKNLDANGSANTYDAYVKHPLIRSRKKNLFLNLQYQHNALKDRIDAVSPSIRTDRDVKSMVLSMNGDMRDGWLGGGVNSYSLSFTSGNVDFNDVTAKLLDANTKQTNGHFTKWMLNLNRLQSIDDRTQLWVSYTEQRASDNLDSSQKMSFGGPYSVRAYDNGTLSADSGSLTTVELRRFLGEFYGAIQGVAFFDTAYAEVNHALWPANTGRNTASLHGAGVGIQWLGQKQISAKVFAASSIGSASSLTRDGDNTVTWLEISKYF